MAFDSSGGASKLASVLTQRMKKCNESPLVLDFGDILPNMSLLTNTFPLPIPKGQYTVCRQLTLGPTHNILTKTQDIGFPHSGSHIHRTIDETGSCGCTVTGTVGEDTNAAPDPPIPSKRAAGKDSSDGMHQHHVLIPEKMRWLKPGDRVLVAWVEDEAVVIDIILNSEVLGP